MIAKKYKVREDLKEKDRVKLSKYSDITAKLLFHRGIKTEEEADEFLNPDFDKHSWDPYQMSDMDIAVDRIIKAVKNKEKVLIYSDYDADGIPGGVLMSDFFDLAGFKDYTNYIPDRHDEGFGLNSEAIEQFKKDNVELIITVDCGIADYEHIKKAKDHGIDVIVTDHHEPNGHLPEAVAILNPKKDDCNYPDKGLCGTGVAWKLVQAILSKERFGIKKGQEKWLLDLVGLATVSDMVPLTGENRMLAHYGLRVLRKTRRPGLNTMLRKLRVSTKYLSEDDIGFTIAPRINAASRMGKPMDGFSLLKTKNYEEAGSVVDHLDKINNERKGIVASLVKEAKKKAREREYSSPDKPVIVLGNPKWKPALLGLTANSLVEEFRKPVFLWGRDGTSYKGSCRSDGSVSLVDLMTVSNGLFKEFGGHKMAGGFTVLDDSIHNIENILWEAYSKISKKLIDEIHWADSYIPIEKVDWGLWDSISPLAPFGMGNEKPLFIFDGGIAESIKLFGKEKNHLEITITNGVKKIKSIAFFSNDESFSKKPIEGEPIKVVGFLEKSVFSGYPELRIRIVDII